MNNPNSFTLKEVDIFIALLLNYNLDYKKMRKLILKLMKRTDYHISQGFLKFLLSVKNPHKYIDEALAESDVIPNIVKELIEEKFVGMVKVNDTFYPITLNISDKEDYHWSIANENMVGVACAHQCMNDLKMSVLKCTVFLFRAYGYSGKPMEFTIAREKRANPYKPKYKNTNYKVAI